MSNLDDFKNKNTVFTGTLGERVSVGTTAQRVDTTGAIRFNSNTNLLEYYTGSDWKPIDTPPSITSATLTAGGTGQVIDSGSGGNISVTLAGTLFATGATVKFTGTDGSQVSASSTTINSSVEAVAVAPASSFVNAKEPYDVTLTNPSGLSGLIENYFNVDQSPVFTTSAGTLGNILNSNRSSYSLATAAATDADGDTITYSISAGALPGGLSLNTSTAAITGTASAVGSTTTYTFTVSAATTDATVTRQFTITVYAETITQLTSSGTGTFNVPTGLTSVELFLVGGGAGGGSNNGGSDGGAGGGAGGWVSVSSYPVTPGGSVPYQVGAGGAQAPMVSYGGNGTPSFFGPVTANGGGGGAHGPGNRNGNPGGSGGGGGGGGGSGSSGGSATQPGANPGTPNVTQYGNGGGSNNNSPPYTGGGGGGAGGGGGNGGGGASGGGGGGRSSSITGSSITYAGGGGGGGAGPSSTNGANGGSGGGGHGGRAPSNSGTPAGSAATANRGSGGGGGAGEAPSWPMPPGVGGAGGSGIVVVKF